MDDIQNLENRAKEWLKNEVAEKRNYENFNIVDAVTATSMPHNDNIVFCFRCTYQWRLNACLKNVDKEIYVLFDNEAQQFRSTIF